MYSPLPVKRATSNGFHNTACKQIPLRRVVVRARSSYSPETSALEGTTDCISRKTQVWNVVSKLQQAETPPVLRAAAYLRASCFAKKLEPFECKEHLLRLRRRSAADAEWESLSSKVAGNHPLYKIHKVFCYVVIIEDDPEHPDVQKMSKELDPSTKLPCGAVWDRPGLVVATLDLNVGPTLPGEELIGHLPRQGQRQHKQRAYLSNLCVTPAARRRGLAAALMSQAEEDAKAMGVRYMYVHVEIGNHAARDLYANRLGYLTEKEERAGPAAASRAGSLCKALLVKPLVF